MSIQPNHETPAQRFDRRIKKAYDLYRKTIDMAEAIFEAEKNAANMEYARAKEEVTRDESAS